VPAMRNLRPTVEARTFFRGIIKPFSGGSWMRWR
jgi:hypothetical protein